jgi:hypothetical protein
MDLSGNAYNFLNHAELGHDIGMNHIFADFDLYSYDFGATT